MRTILAFLMRLLSPEPEIIGRNEAVRRLLALADKPEVRG